MAGLIRGFAMLPSSKLSRNLDDGSQLKRKKMQLELLPLAHQFCHFNRVAEMPSRPGCCGNANRSLFKICRGKQTAMKSISKPTFLHWYLLCSWLSVQAITSLKASILLISIHDPDRIVEQTIGRRPLDA
jgi:hypothetical protein